MIECTSGIKCMGDTAIKPDKVVRIDGAEGDGNIPMPAVFEGSSSDIEELEAEVAGWEENEYGWVCPKCIKDDFSDEESSGAALATADGNDLPSLMIAAAAHSNVNRSELARQAIEANRDRESGVVNMDTLSQSILGLPQGHQAPVKALVVEMLNRE